MPFATNQTPQPASEFPAVGDRILGRKLRVIAKREQRRALGDAIEAAGHHVLEQTPRRSSDALDRELDRVGASLRTAGFGFGVTVADLGEDVVILGPKLAQQPRRSWRGPHSEALWLLTTLLDEAGTESFWALFDPDTA